MIVQFIKIKLKVWMNMKKKQFINSILMAESGYYSSNIYELNKSIFKKSIIKLNTPKKYKICIPKFKNNLYKKILPS